MSKKIMIFSLVLGLGIVVSNVQAEEDVYVDLSVLNNLTSSSEYPTVSTQPLFPEIKEAPKVRTKKAPKINKVKIVEKKAEPIIHAPEVKSSPIDSKPEAVEVEVNREFIAEIEEDAKSAPVISPEPSPFATETAFPSETISAASVQPVTSMEMPVEIPAVEAPESIAPVVEAPIEPLVSAGVEGLSDNASNQLYFEGETYELTPAHKAQVDNIIKNFENLQKNKVLILSYNFDDGQDIFKKKRQSLNRAIEVRSYLLAQGYKNFSIKVINITDDVSKRNKIAIEELK